MISLCEILKPFVKYGDTKYNHYLTIVELKSLIDLLSQFNEIDLGDYFTIIPFYENLKNILIEYDLYDFCVDFKINPSENEKKEHNQKEREMEYHSDAYFRILTEEHRDKMWILLDKFDSKGFVNALKEYFDILVNVILPQIYEKDIKNRYDNEYLGYFSFEISSK